MMQNKRRSIFYPYHPFATYSKDGNDEFLNADGELVLKGWIRHHSPSENPDIRAVFDVGKDAFDRLSQDPYSGLDSGLGNVESVTISSPDEFDLVIFRSYADAILKQKEALCQRIEKGGIHLLDSGTGNDMSISDIEEGSRPWFVCLQWRFFDCFGAETKMQHAPFFRELFLIATLESVGNVLLGMSLDGRGQVEASSWMYECYHTALAIESSHLLVRAVQRSKAKNGAAAKLANDPKQHAKADVYKHWRAWQAGEESYRGQAAFARAMLVEWSNVLKSQPSIEAWCRQWRKGENIPLTEPAQ